MDQHLLFSEPWINLTVIGETDEHKSGLIESDTVYTLPVDEKWPTADYIVDLIRRDKKNVYRFVIIHDREHTVVEAIYDVPGRKWITVASFDDDHVFNAEEYINRTKFFK